MGLGDCLKCWNAYCTCGYEYRQMPLDGLRSIVRAASRALAEREEGKNSESPLTPRQRDALAFIRGFVETEGIGPTFDEIGRALGIGRVTAFGHVAELERKGFLRRLTPGASRALRPTRPLG